MAEGQRYYWYAGPVADDARLFPLVVHLLVANHLDPVNINYLQIFDSNIAVVPGSVPLAEITLYPSGVAMYAPSMNGRRFSNLRVYLSSTPGILTAVANPLLTLFGEARQP